MAIYDREIPVNDGIMKINALEYEAEIEAENYNNVGQCPKCGQHWVQVSSGGNRIGYTREDSIIIKCDCGTNFNMESGQSGYEECPDCNYMALNLTDAELRIGLCDGANITSEAICERCWDSRAEDYKDWRYHRR